MVEKRKCKRLDLSVSIQLERLSNDGIMTVKYLTVDVSDISKSGIGFSAGQELEIGTYYDTKIQIWTKEVIDAVIQIVRRAEKDGRYQYGAIFIGMAERDALKIDIYESFNEL